MAIPPRIALIADTRSSYVRGLIAGITSYGQDFGPWSYRLYTDPLDHGIAKLLRADGVDGVLARVHLHRIGRELAKLDVPVVDLKEEVPIVGIPQIVANDRAVVRMALDHLIERGLRSIGFVGLRGVRYSEIRRRHLAELCRERASDLISGPTGRSGCSHTLLLDGTANGNTFDTVIGDWIADIPKPLGLVACNDVWASAVLLACRARGIDVPEQVAVVGVDDDLIYC